MLHLNSGLPNSGTRNIHDKKSRKKFLKRLDRVDLITIFIVLRKMSINPLNIVVMEKYLKKFGNFEVELSGSLLSIKENGLTFHAKNVSAIAAVNQFEMACKRVETYVLKQSK
jgi:hypothetical protein